MKRKTYIYIVLCLLSVCVATILAFAHGGKTDANGGHYDRSTGEYHYHHGYPAHQHTNGVCPYDYDDKTNHSSGGSSSNNGKSETTAPQETQRESESLSWEEWKEQHWKRADTTEAQRTTEETTKKEENFFVKVYRKNPVLVIALGIWAVIGTYCYIKDKIKKGR